MGVASTASAVAVSPPQPADPPVSVIVPAVVASPVVVAAPAQENCAEPSTDCGDETSVEEAVPLAPMPEPVDSLDPSCRLGNPHRPQGTTAPIATSYEAPEAPRVLQFRIEVEDGVAIDGDCFAETVAGILNDSRGWGENGSLAFQPVTNDDPDFRLILASPDMTDRLCYPLRTGGKYSCRNRSAVILNLARWESGTEEYAGNLEEYRQYLVNHEVGHLLGHGHARCPGPGEPAPVMMQQTKGLGECLLNGWPTRDER